MLVLSRKQGESIIVGDGIVVTTLRVSRNKVLIGIEAPKSVSIKRSEVQDSPNQTEKE